jgi:AcrR family transcriptional regulator
MTRTGQVTPDRIASAGLRLFAERGYAGTSMEQVRRAAGISNGSLYHHFPSRAHLAARLVLDGMRQCQDGVRRVLAGAGSAEAGIRGVVEDQSGWVEDHADLARLLYGELPDDVLLAAEPRFGEDNRRYVEDVGGWLRARAERGELRRLPFSVTHALWLGPAQELARQWLQGRSRLTPRDASPDLAEGAWRALAGSPTTATAQEGTA